LLPEGRREQRVLFTFHDRQHVDGLLRVVWVVCDDDRVLRIVEIERFEDLYIVLDIVRAFRARFAFEIERSTFDGVQADGYVAARGVSIGKALNGGSPE